MQPVHYAFAVRLGGQERLVFLERVCKNLLIRMAPRRIARSERQIEPAHRRFQLVASGIARPSGVSGERELVRQRQNWVKPVAGSTEVSTHRLAAANGAFQPLGFAGDGMQGEKASDDDSAIEEIG